MTDYQILTIIAAFIIVDIAVLSLVAIPLMRRRLAARIDKTAAEEQTTSSLPADPLGTVSAGRLAAAIGTHPTRSAPVTTIGAVDPGDVPPTASRQEIGENRRSNTVAPDVLEAIAAAHAATEVGHDPTANKTDSDDARDGEQDEAYSMDSAEMSVARARGFAIHPEDPLVASTIDRLLGARREWDAATAGATADTAPATETAPATATETPTGATGGADQGAAIGASGPSPSPVGGQPAQSHAAARGTGSGRPVMASGVYTTEGVLVPTIDLETGLDNQLSWSMAITIEEARSGRYGRPVSIVIAELDGLDKLAELFGTEVADKLIRPVADALRANARAADRVARLSHTRFGVLLVETDEIRAINYVERVRSACDRWLEASAIALRLSIGWASPATDGDLKSAVRIAEDRMHREQHRPAPWRPEAEAAPQSAVPAPNPSRTDN
jgi:diguanylate cyclase (GGDEF)-like protein